MPRLKYKILVSYYKERFKPIPWLIIPIILVIFSVSKIEVSIIINYLYFLNALLFYRLFDDLMMIDFDLKNKGHRSFHENGAELQILVFLPLVVYLAHTFLVYKSQATIYSIAFIILQLFLYSTLRLNQMSQFISILKYFFLPLVFISWNSPWPYLSFSLFLLHELISEKYIHVNLKIFYGLFASILLLKLLTIIFT